MGADDLELHPCICREIREFYTTQKADPVLWKCIRVNHARVLQNLLQEADTAYGLRLPAPCLTVTRIFAPVALSASLRNSPTHLWIDHTDKVIQLGRYLVVSLL